MLVRRLLRNPREGRQVVETWDSANGTPVLRQGRRPWPAPTARTRKSSCSRCTSSSRLWCTSTTILVDWVLDEPMASPPEPPRSAATAARG